MNEGLKPQDEHPLPGGNVTVGVLRVGGTVRLPRAATWAHRGRRRFGPSGAAVSRCAFARLTLRNDVVTLWRDDSLPRSRGSDPVANRRAVGGARRAVGGEGGRAFRHDEGGGLPPPPDLGGCRLRRGSRGSSATPVSPEPDTVR